MSATRFAPEGPLRGALQPPPDKSISHRAAILAAMGEGETTVSRYLDAADTRSTLAAIGKLGAGVAEADSAGDALELRIRGVGLRGPRGCRIDVGNAGTLLRILPGWLAGQEGRTFELDGDESVRRRPVDRVAEPLGLMGAGVTCVDGRLPPIAIVGSALRGITYELPVASAQVKSCVLLAGLLASGRTEVLERTSSRDHTERMLRAAGVEVKVADRGTVAMLSSGRGKRIALGPVERIEPGEIEIPGDFSSAAFWLVAAILVPGSQVRVEGVGLNPTRVGLLGILSRMGAPLEVEAELGLPGGEVEGVVSARHGPLTGTRVHPAEVPVAIDELPLIGLAGCFAEGETIVTGAEELRHKESDRIEALVDGLRAVGGDVEARPDGFAVRGTGGIRGGRLDSRADHRLAMLGAVAGLASREGVDVDGVESAAISYPGFEADLRSLV